MRSPEHIATLWAGSAVNVLVRKHGMSFVQANQLMTRVNLDLIRRAPLRYAVSVLDGVVLHLWVNTPALPIAIRLPLTALELSIVALCLLSVTVWGSFHLLVRVGAIGAQASGKWNWRDSTIAALLGIFLYSVLLTCAVEAGRPEHRIPVQFLIPLLLVSCAHRLWTARPDPAETPAPESSDKPRYLAMLRR